MGRPNGKAIEALRARFRGEIVLPGSPSYDDARRLWNGMFDRRPALVARCIGTHDVLEAVRFSQEHGLPLAVKGGGHNSAGTGVCDDGLVVDLSRLRRVTVHTRHKTAHVDGGCLLGDMDYETQLHGLAVPAGIISHTGVGGLALGGGFGWISRKHGLSVDNLLAAEVVTAGGRLVNAGPEENPELFWGLRGGGGNFGVVTSFVFRCAEIGREVYSGFIVKPFAEAERYLRFHRDYVRDLPDEMTVWAVLRHAPPLPFLPPDVHGKLVVIVPFVWLGDPGRGAALVRPLREVLPTVGEAVGTNPWLAWQSGFDPLVPHGARNYWKSHHLQELSDACIEQLLTWSARMPTQECEAFIPHMEGAPSRVAEDATAYPHRRTPFLLNIHTHWQQPADDARCQEWARGFHAATQPFARGVYVNFLGQEGEERIREAYTPAVWKRLVAVKNQWDPDNLFRMNQNIRPLPEP